MRAVGGSPTSPLLDAAVRREPSPGGPPVRRVACPVHEAMETVERGEAMSGRTGGSLAS